MESDLVMHLTDFERGTRSPEEVLVEHLARKDRTRKEGARSGPITLVERRARRSLAKAACEVLGEHQLVAERLGIHATAVTRWVNGRTVVPARHLPGLTAIVDAPCE